MNKKIKIYAAVFVLLILFWAYLFTFNCCGRTPCKPVNDQICELNTIIRCVFDVLVVFLMVIVAVVVFFYSLSLFPSLKKYRGKMIGKWAPIAALIIWMILSTKIYLEKCQVIGGICSKTAVDEINKNHIKNP